MNLTAAYRVEDASGVGEPRRAATAIAQGLGFSESRAGQAALVVSELATNLAKHARRGEMLLRRIRRDDADGDPDGLEILAVDAGPGLADVAASRRDGYSTTGTLGHGLGAIERLADFVEIYTQPSGTVVLARLARERAPARVRQPPYEIGAIQVSHPGEQICGDDWDWRLRDTRLSILMADGLGHGLPAHEAAREATAVYRRCHDEPPKQVLAQVHSALRGTRGAAVSMLAIDLENNLARYSGLGNITATVLPLSGGRQTLMSQNGTAGHTAPTIQEHAYPIPSKSMVILYSDGLGSQWDLAAYPGLRMRHPSIIAGVLYRDFSRRRDDVTVAVAKSREGTAATK
jgi:anti-sigma regulatory factor (Ser/Thr protein kinase)